MKRATIWILAVGLAGFMSVVSCQAKERKPKDEAAKPAVQEPPQAPPVFTFATEEEMQEFAKVWQQRQTSLAKMAVLQGYFTQEQEAVQRITEELATKYHLDSSKSYALDIPRKALIEVERKEPPISSQLSGPSAPASHPRWPPNSPGRRRTGCTSTRAWPHASRIHWRTVQQRSPCPWGRPHRCRPWPGPWTAAARTPRSHRPCRCTGGSQGPPGAPATG